MVQSIGSSDAIDLWTVLEDYEAGSAESSHSFSFSAVDFDDDAELVLIIDGVSTLALNLLLRMNNITTSNYFYDGRRITGGAETLLDTNTATSITIATNTLLDEANATMFIIIHINLSKGASSIDYPAIHCNAYGSRTVEEKISGIINTDQTSISDIDILTSTSSWKIGTRMTFTRWQGHE